MVIGKYEKYKESGVKWLGQIPARWDMVPGFTILIENKSKNTGMKRNTVLSLSYGNIRVKKEEELTGLVPESFETYQLINVGDIIFRPTDLQNDKVSLRSSISEHEGIITNAYLSIKPKNNVSAKFYHYFFRAIDHNKIIYGLGSGLRQNISYQDFKKFLFPCPSLPEQKAIATFLDDKTAKIDQLIQIKQKEINLLKERRQILIQKAVTKGLDTTVKMKHSGVDWIGEIPEHWEVRKFKHFTKILSGYSPEQVNFVNAKNINFFKVDDLNNVDKRYRLGDSNWYIDDSKIKKIYDKNILLIPKRGGAISTNKIAITTTACVFDTNVMGLQFNIKMVNLDLIAIWLKSRNLISIADITTIPQINNKHIYPLQIALPNLEEQQKIKEYLDNKTAKVAKVISINEQEIEKLKEYKTILIDNVVTGKLRVS